MKEADDADLDARLIALARAEEAREQRRRRVPTWRGFAVSLALCSLVSIAGALAIDRLLLRPDSVVEPAAGSRAPDGVDVGGAIDLSLSDPSDLGDRIDELSDRVDGLEGTLQELEESTGGLQDDVRDVADDLAGLCGSLSLADALSSEVLSC